MNFRDFETSALKDTALFKPIQLGSIELQHRVVLAPLTRLRIDDNVPKQFVQEYYSQRSKTPGTFVITEGTLISPEYGSGPPNVPEIWNDKHVEAWKPIHAAIHKNGSFSFQQLWTLGWQATPSGIVKRGLKFIGATDDVYMDEDSEKDAIASGTPIHGLTKEEIKECIQHFVRAAKNSLKAGADGVEIHSANGYLLNQFLDPRSNKRTDEYGGSIENRARFTLEVTDALIDAVGAEKVGIRFSPWGTYGGMTGHTDPLIFAQFAYIIGELERRGRAGNRLAYIHLVEPRVPNLRYEEGDYIVPTGSNDFVYSIWNGVVIRAGDYALNPDLAAEHSAMGQTLIAYGRFFIANPDLPERLRNGEKLTQYIKGLFYEPTTKGYTDYPTYEEIEKDGFPDDKDLVLNGAGYEEALRF